MSIMICSESTSFTATVWAEGIEQALSLARTCYPSSEASVVFPIESADFFVKGLAISSGIVHPEMLEQAAG